MDRETFLEEMGARKGQFASATWTSVVKTAAAFKSSKVVKTTTATIRTGIAYANLGQNEGTETGPLPWGEWAIFPLVIVHHGEDYYRLYLSEGAKVVTTYTVDGVDATREEVEAMMTPSALKPREGGPVLTFTVKAANLLTIANATT